MWFEEEEVGVQDTKRVNCRRENCSRPPESKGRRLTSDTVCDESEVMIGRQMGAEEVCDILWDQMLGLEAGQPWSYLGTVSIEYQ